MKRIRASLGVLAIMLGLGFGSAAFDVVAAQGSFGDISGVDAVKIIKSEKDILVLDVRTRQEYAEGHLKGARLIPVDELDERLKEIAAFKNKKVLVVCLSGGRSRKASGILANSGFEKVFNVSDGMRGVGKVPGAPIER